MLFFFYDRIKFKNSLNNNYIIIILERIVIELKFSFFSKIQDNGKKTKIGLNFVPLCALKLVIIVAWENPLS
jgi:hypothetical protein